MRCDCYFCEMAFQEKGNRFKKQVEKSASASQNGRNSNAIKFSNDTERLQHVNSIRKAPVGAQMKRVIDILFEVYIILLSPSIYYHKSLCYNDQALNTYIKWYEIVLAFNQWFKIESWVCKGDEYSIRKSLSSIVIFFRSNKINYTKQYLWSLIRMLCFNIMFLIRKSMMCKLFCAWWSFWMVLVSLMLSVCACVCFTDPTGFYDRADKWSMLRGHES